MHKIEASKLLTVLVSTALIAGCGPREARVDDESARPTVGSVRSSDGVEIRYETAGRGEPALVFVHGWSCDRSYWREQMDHFAASHRVVALDLGGHGESGLGREDWTMAAFGSDVRAVVEELDLRRVVLVGHSMGTYVIFEAARLTPDRVVALVPVDQIFDPDVRLTEEQREGFIGPMRDDFPTATATFVSQHLFVPGTDSALVGWIARDMAAAPAAVAISAMEDLLVYDEAQALATAKAPVHVINAGLWPTNADAVRRHQPNVELTVLPSRGHFVMMEAPDEFNRALARVLSERPARP